MCWLQLLPPHTLLVVCLLVCWLGREAVSHLDLIRGALLGQLPLLDMPARCRHLLDSPEGSALPISMMKNATSYGMAALNSGRGGGPGVKWLHLHTLVMPALPMHIRKCITAYSMDAGAHNCILVGS